MEPFEFTPNVEGGEALLRRVKRHRATANFACLWNAKPISPGCLFACPVECEAYSSGAAISNFRPFKTLLAPPVHVIGIVIAAMIQHGKLFWEQNYTRHAFYIHLTGRSGLPEGGHPSIHISFQKLSDKPNDFS
ncbi:MAG: hypothetical protein K8R45_14380 [Desulfobacterales bacterium]|nr:hypothetical protein [Desulfobacterales bacterium]